MISADIHILTTRELDAIKHTAYRSGRVNAFSDIAEPSTRCDPKDAPATIEVDGVWYDRRDTVDALTNLLAEARTKNETYREVIRGFRQKELAANPTPTPKTTKSE